MRPCLVALSLALGACAGVPLPGAPPGSPPPPAEARAAMPAAVQANPALSAREIVARAHEAAGGADWRDVRTLYLEGYNIIRRADGSEVLWDRYAMWREFSDDKTDAHAA